MHYLITGATGYIGSHMAALLHQQGHKLTLIDNFSNSDHKALERLYELCRRLNPSQPLPLFSFANIEDEKTLNTIFKNGPGIDAVLHFAGLKAVGESGQQPLHYYQNNVSGTLSLLNVMEKNNVFSLVFSSSATVYGEPEVLPVHEQCRTQTTNPYGTSKRMCEEMLQDIAQSNPKWRFAVLRYFNPVGAHESGIIGERPNGVPNNLMPYVFDVASGHRPCVNVFGDDYETQDGSGVRDYIHVMDLVEGHSAALDYLNSAGSGCSIFNLGCGRGYSVFDMIKRTESITQRTIPYRVVERRSGDLGEVYADPSLAKKVLNWSAKRDLDDMLSDQWRWQQTLNGES